MIIDFSNIIKEKNITPKGVFHIGAHIGQELTVYESIGFKKVCMIEANPEIYKNLSNLKSDICELSFFNYAISDSNGTANFYVTSNFRGGGDMSSSLLELSRHKILYPGIRHAKTIEVNTIKLNDLIKENNLNPKDYNMLNLDIQGAELLALKGATDILSEIDIINSEVNKTELYKGCALINELTSFLESYGFYKFTESYEHSPEWGDAIFLKK